MRKAIMEFSQYFYDFKIFKFFRRTRNHFDFNRIFDNKDIR